MSQVPGFDKWAPDCPACGSLNVEVTDDGWSCPHCKNEGDRECMVRIEFEEETAPISVDTC